jgi:phage baseplate assembly protein W
MPQVGTDLALSFSGPSGLFEDADLATEGTSGRMPRQTDLGVVADLAAADQLLVNRLKTQKGELASLGHPEYGSRHHELVGEPNVERTRNLVKLHVLEALSHEPRILEILSCRVSAPHAPPREVVRIEIDLRLIDRPTPLNLVVPFSLEVGG